MGKIITHLAIVILLALGSCEVAHLDDGNFHSTVSADPLQMWMVFFHADWVSDSLILVLNLPRYSEGIFQGERSDAEPRH